jgi:organic radical activating enzyme
MKVNEIFSSIQGEGRFAGCPVTFVRLSGCNLSCEWCDTKYHTNGQVMSVEEVTKKIKELGENTVVWTGGEPLLQQKEIVQVIEQTETLQHHLETNGTLITTKNARLFDYVCVSPKSVDTCVKLNGINCNNEVKVVTDLDVVGKEMLHYATMLMPLTTSNDNLNTEIKQKVWDFCSKNGLKFCLRQHVEVWGVKKRGV